MDFVIQTTVTMLRYVTVDAASPEQAQKLYEEGVGEWLYDDSLDPQEGDLEAIWLPDGSLWEPDIRERETRDANDWLIQKGWGLRICEHCNLVMSEGFSTDNGDVYACSEEHLKALGVEQSSEYDIEHDDGSSVYYTDWEGCHVSEEAADRLYQEPYNWTFEEVSGLDIET
jgi:hypothetical protein